MRLRAESEHIPSSMAGSLLPSYSAAPAGVRLTAFEGLSTSDVEVAIDKLPNKSPSADHFAVPVLKSVADHLSPFLTFLFNRSLDSFRPVLRTLS